MGGDMALFTSVEPRMAEEGVCVCGLAVYYEYVRAELLRVKVFFAGAPGAVSESLSASACVCVCLLSPFAAAAAETLELRPASTA